MVGGVKKDRIELQDWSKADKEFKEVARKLEREDDRVVLYRMKRYSYGKDGRDITEDAYQDVYKSAIMTTIGVLRLRGKAPRSWREMFTEIREVKP